MADREPGIGLRAARCPFAKLPDKWRRLKAPGSRLINLHGGRRRKLRFADQPPRFELDGPLGKDIGADARQVGLQFRESPRTEPQFAKHEPRPALTDHLPPTSSPARTIPPSPFLL